MSPIEKPFVIILDEDVEGSPGQWRVVHRDPTLEIARLHTQYEGVIGEYPRDRYRARKQEQKTLVHVPSGDVKRGAIYELSEIAARRRAARAALVAKAKFKAPSAALRKAKPRAAVSVKKVARKSKAKFAPVIVKKWSIKRAGETYAPILTGKKPKPGRGGR